MKAFKSLLFTSPGIFIALVIGVTSMARAADITPNELAVIRKKLSALRDTVDGNGSKRNLSAGDVFMTASKDPKAAVELFLKCYKEVRFTRENRKESDFRVWREGMEDQLNSPAFIEALQIQLRYLAISCRAAEVEDFEQVFVPLMEYVDGLSRLEEMPNALLMKPVGNSIFAQTYYLEKLLNKNDEWEQVAYNIEGIYNRAILPHLRKKKREALMGAWDRRIEQQTRLVAFLSKQNEKELRGKGRDQEVRIRNRQDSRGGILRAHDAEKFARETLPRLKWQKLIDSYKFIDQVAGVKALLAYLESNVTHPSAEDWLEQLEALLGKTEGELETAGEGKPAPVPTTDNKTGGKGGTAVKKFDPNGFD